MRTMTTYFLLLNSLCLNILRSARGNQIFYVIETMRWITQLCVLTDSMLSANTVQRHRYDEEVMMMHLVRHHAEQLVYIEAGKTSFRIDDRSA